MVTNKPATNLKPSTNYQQEQQQPKIVNNNNNNEHDHYYQQHQYDYLPTKLALDNLRTCAHITLNILNKQTISIHIRVTKNNRRRNISKKKKKQK